MMVNSSWILINSVTMPCLSCGSSVKRFFLDSAKTRPDPYLRPR